MITKEEANRRFNILCEEGLGVLNDERIDSLGYVDLRGLVKYVVENCGLEATRTHGYLGSALMYLTDCGAIDEREHEKWNMRYKSKRNR